MPGINGEGQRMIRITEIHNESPCLFGLQYPNARDIMCRCNGSLPAGSRLERSAESLYDPARGVTTSYTKLRTPAWSVMPAATRTTIVKKNNASNHLLRHKLLTCELGELPLFIQNYIQPLKIFIQKITFYEALVRDFNIASRFRDSLEEILLVLEEVLRLCDQVLHEKIDGDYFCEEIKSLANESLLKALDSYPGAVVGSQNKVPDDIEKQLNEVELLFERLWEDLRDSGYEFLRHFIY